MDNPKYEIYKGHDDQFYFRLRAANGEVILASEGYTTADACRGGIESVRENASNDERYRREDAADGQFYFVLSAPNGEAIGMSERYTTERWRDGGIQVVMMIAPEAPVEVTT